MNRCWYGTNQYTYIPEQMGGNLNLSYKGVEVKDGSQCMIWEDDQSHSIFDVRLSDLAIVEMDLPYVLAEAVPIFSFFGLGEGRTIIHFTDIVIGAPDPSIFIPPPGACIHVYPEPNDDVQTIHFRDSVDFMKNMFLKNPVISALTEFDPAQHLIEKLQRASQYHRKLDSNIIQKKRLTNQGPIPPKLNQTFSAQWTLVANRDLNPPYTPYTLSGKLAFDFTTSGLSWSIESSTGNIPLDLQMEWRLSPSFNGVDFMQVGPDGNCYNYVFFQWLWTYFVPHFEIPYDSAQQGSAVVNGDKCTVWQTTWNWYDQFAELYIRDSDHVLVQLTVPEPFGHGLATVTLTDIKPTVNPNAYSRPPNCVETMTWNPSWESHLPWYWW